MQKLCLILLIASLILPSCNPNQPKENTANPVSLNASDTLTAGETYLRDCKQYKASAKLMDSILMSQNEVVPESANQAIKAFTDFAYYCASDSLSPVYLIKTAQVARVINNIPQAKLVLERCIEHYPAFSNRAAAIFLLAQLYDEATYLNDEHQARALYQKIIDEYPSTVWAINAKAAMKFLGKSDEEMIREFRKKSK